VNIIIELINLKIMAKNENPFAIRKSPVSIITAQAVNLDDYVQKTIYDGDRVSVCATVD
jgi:hypothetical protein